MGRSLRQAKPAEEFPLGAVVYEASTYSRAYHAVEESEQGIAPLNDPNKDGTPPAENPEGRLRPRSTRAGRALSVACGRVTVCL